MGAVSVTRFKQCTKCRCTKPYTLEFFPPDKRTRSGLFAQCRPCRYAQYRIWYENGNKQVAQERTRAWVKSNPERIALFHKRYRSSDKGKRTESKRNRSEKRRLYRKLNPPKEDRTRKRNYEARKRNAEGKHTVQEIKQMLRDQDNVCAYCETHLTEFHVDHMIPLSRGGRNDWTNLALTCAFCNISKNAQTVEEFMEVLME